MQRITCLLISLFLFNSFSALATHLIAGEIVVKQSECNERTFIITLILYGDMSSPVSPGGDGTVLDFGDGSQMSIPSGSFKARSDLPDGIGVFEYTIEHTCAMDGLYTISYSEPNRNGGILNISNSITTFFYIETNILVASQICNSVPVFLSPPIDQACSGLAFYHNPGAFDADGDSLSYKLVVPLRGANQATEYRSLDAPSFYSNNYQTANEAGDGPPTFRIDSFNGTITWDAPGAVGEYNIAFVVEEWRMIDSVFVKIGTVIRDMQIIVTECPNLRPVLIIPQDICVEAGTPISETIFGTDPDGHDVKIEVFSGIFSFENNPANYTPNPPVFQSSVPQASLEFEWTPSCEAVRNQPYQITVKITDKPSSGAALVLFRTWNIKVTAPAPAFTEAALDPVQRHGLIKWSPYFCSNATAVQIWRRVGSFNYSPDECASGLPRYAGYTKVGEVPPGALEYIDTNNGLGLAPGAVYCYRLTAIFPLAGGAESKASIEICLPPVLAEAPVITHVTVDKTHETDGAITISWRSPYDLDPEAYTQPYEYALLRAEGFEGNTGMTQVQIANILDTTYTDDGVNTKELVYNYRIVLKARISVSDPLISIDTSASASTVSNTAIPLPESIGLAWEAITPWTNYSQDYPLHLVYRSSEGEGLDNFVLIDSVDVFENGFNYIDNGNYQGIGLDQHELYCYRIKTRGTYGNPAIAAPQENFSQVFCSRVLDLVPPCTPVLVQTEINCGLFNAQTPCSQRIFSHAIQWLSYPDECLEDIFFYNVYASDSKTDEYTLIGVTSGNEFVENNLAKLSRCYRISAVDRAGNESELSDALCFDNCPSIYFPNIISPNGDLKNEFFTEMNSEIYCSRFVKSVALSVYNRWGQKLIDLKSEETLNWDGKDKFGKQVPTGVYYYFANIEFDAIEPANQTKQVKGWIHIVY
ncbi:MAG: gliding motility-associated C-terminal domain-containing protein [Cyclobacteriaceae bacterium]|nr:gliding motility-associated C-terminal domain-containing protein [Cyclobacteriaceae bacterium]